MEKNVILNEIETPPNPFIIKESETESSLWTKKASDTCRLFYECYLSIVYVYISERLYIFNDPKFPRISHVWFKRETLLFEIFR